MTKEITPAFYWDLSDLPKFVKGELKRRVESQQGKPNYSDSTDFTVNKYTHPVAAWVRVCSNSVVQYGKESRAGFIMSGMIPGGFKSKHGFLKGENGSTLGYTADGKIRHRIENERFKHRPSPGIISVESQLGGGDGKFRITTIKWKCWSTDQLTYMTPYWLTNSVSVSIEFGWNNFNPMSSLELSDSRKMLEHFYDGKELVSKVKLSNGNYDASMGIISDFSYDLKDDGSYDCVTVVKNVGGFFSGVYSAGRSTNSSKTGDSKKPEWKKYIEDRLSNDVLSIAKNLHKTGTESIDSQVFYSRPKNIDTVRGNRQSVDFDNDDNNWWMSFGLFVKILNTKMSALDQNTDNAIFKLNIDDVLIGAHPNLKSGNGNVLLIPNSMCPDISIDELPSSVESISSQTSDPDLRDANAILESSRIAFNSNGSGKKVKIARYDLNKIINWWAKKDQSSLSFPASVDNGRVKKYKTGYLKNLYINFNAIKDLKTADSFKTLLETLLKQMSDAAGGIWDFRIVPLNPDGEGNGTLTIMDANYSNFVSDVVSERIWNFEFNNNLSLITGLSFSVKSTNAVATQTLFGKGTEVRGEVVIPGTNNSIDQTIALPIGLSVNDRLLSGFKDVPVTVQSKTGEEKEEKDPIQDRLIVQEAQPKRFLYTYGNRTYSFVEHVGSVQSGLIYGGDSNSLRLYALQPGITVKVTIPGISGIRNLHTFTINDLPPPYGNGCFFQVQNVEHVIVNNEWNTVITAGVRRRPPYIK